MTRSFIPRCRGISGLVGTLLRTRNLRVTVTSAGRALPAKATRKECRDKPLVLKLSASLEGRRAPTPVECPSTESTLRVRPSSSLGVTSRTIPSEVTTSRRPEGMVSVFDITSRVETRHCHPQSCQCGPKHLLEREWPRG